MAERCADCRYFKPTRVDADDGSVVGMCSNRDRSVARPYYAYGWRSACSGLTPRRRVGDRR